MAQQFGADAQMLASPITIVTTAETNGPSTNFVTINFENGKFYVSGTVLLQTGTGTTAVQIRVRRNINGENVVLGVTAQLIAVAASTIYSLGFDFTDAIPDNRPCQYTFTVQATGATGNGSILANSCISSTLLSG
jgi:hypothetical protein